MRTLAITALALAPALFGAGCTCNATCSAGGGATDGGISTSPEAGGLPAASAEATGASATVRLVAREHAAGRCPAAAARTLVGTTAAGAACTEAKACAPICCACASSPVGWLAAACIDGACAGPEGACAEPSSPAFCDEPHTTSTTTGHSNYRCAPGGGKKKPGDACSEGAECASTCCPCPGSRSWSASACVNGVCAGRGTTCAVAPMHDDDYCGEPPASSSRSVRGEQENGRCPSPPHELLGTKKAGQPCASHTDCLPSCCDCATGGSSWLAGACIDGRCAATSVACLETENDKSYCGGHCGGEGAPCWRGDACCSDSCEKHRCR